MSEYLLKAENIRKTYQMGRRNVEVLRGVSVQLRRGDFLALRGASGAGKSTLLHLLGGLDRPDQGEIWIHDRPLNKLSMNELAEFRNEKVGFIFQAYYLLPEFDALENVCIPARMARRPAKLVEEEARELLKRVGLGERLDHRPSELSGGEQQRVAIARALINHPEIVLADEPTGNLDSHTGEEIMDLLCQLRDERKVTLVIATHDSKLAARAPQVIRLIDGVVSENETATAVVPPAEV
ncbi:MAG: ABC transporter ATP-binding protein [Verrucomicrobiales bacterium]